MHWSAFTSHAACHSFFTVRRLGSVAARRSTAERLTRSPATGSRIEGDAGIVRRVGDVPQAMDFRALAGHHGFGHDTGLWRSLAAVYAFRRLS